MSSRARGIVSFVPGFLPDDIVDEGDVADAGEKLTEYFAARKQRAKLRRVK
jgi:hypothetical protein